MYLPSSRPSEYSALWLNRQIDGDVRTKGSQSREPSDCLASGRGLTTRGTSRFSISNYYAGGAHWGFGMWDEHSNIKNLYSIERDQEFRDEQQTRVREFGYDYLIPPGMTKTMRSLLEASEEDQEDVGDEDEMIEQTGFTPEEEDEDDFAGNERLVIVGEEESDQAMRTENTDVGDHEQSGDHDENDLDADIPEADDAGYDDYDDDEYDEDEYQEGFMAEEEYEEDSSTVEPDDRRTDNIN
jgi:hypothetical protein